MWVCDGCDRLWKARLMACPACGAVPRPFGSQAKDTGHRLAARMPLHIRTGEPLPLSPMSRPPVRSSIAEWQDWAVSTGVDPSVAAGMTKPELQGLPGRVGEAA